MNTLPKALRAIVLFSACLWCFPAIAADVECVRFPGCEELGYTQTASSCEDGLKVLCPLDTTKAFCETKSEECRVGAILGNDQKCYSKAEDMPSSVYAVAVVFDADKRLAVGLNNIDSAGNTGYQIQDQWIFSPCSISSVTCENDYQCSTSSKSDGYTNTQNILNSGCGYVNAIMASYNYNPGSCNGAEFCKQNKWFLPSKVELDKLFSDSVFYKVNTTLILLAPDFRLADFSSSNKSGYWSSNLQTSSKAWNAGTVTGLGKIRPILKF